VNLKDGYARVTGTDVWLYNVHISPYEKGTHYNHDPLRPRKLLLRIEQIKRLIGKTREKGLTLVPLSMYLKENKWAKVELALVKGKAKHDKREAIAERDAKRAMEKTLKQRE
jgi:SsrA-binding protein